MTATSASLDALLSHLREREQYERSRAEALRLLADEQSDPDLRRCDLVHAAEAEAAADHWRGWADALAALLDREGVPS